MTEKPDESKPDAIKPDTITSDTAPLSQPMSQPAPLRRGWTTGACATAATKSALTALITGTFPDPVTITLPKGQQPAFSLTYESLGDGYASAGIVKDAGDDPDVTHGATIISTVQPLAPGSGIRFAAGDGVGMVTLAGLPVGVGEPAINPVPRTMMEEVVNEICSEYGLPGTPDWALSADCRCWAQPVLCNPSPVPPGFTPSIAALTWHGPLD